jgi:metal-responsive CopG/Arc/MetJ family transcriptional regulator
MKSTEPNLPPSKDLPHKVKIIQTKVPDALLRAVDDYVSKNDTDRSKFVRQAIRRALPSNTLASLAS